MESNALMELRNQIYRAWEDGGDLPACPLCGLGRVQRTNYIRCLKCGVNWLDGEGWSKNPSIER